ncbi:unnamed protein product [Tilletia caries]|nr:unnamed protein product [Tilletia caries]CAD7063099.1 unnamed protein product [Tilletia caries]
MSGSRTLSSHSGASPQADSQDQRQQHALRAKVARWTVVLAGVGLVSYAVLPSEEKGSSKSSFASLFGRSGASHGELSAHLHPFRYGRFEVLSVHHTTTPSLLESDPSGDGQHVLLRIKASVDPAGQSKETGALRIESVYLKEPALQIERAYTPLRRPGNPTGLGVEAIPREEGHQPAEVIELLIKRYPDGELSRYASTLRAGDIVELRGPVSTWEWNRDHQNAADANTAAHSLPQDILMLVGGTGITTAHQLLHTVAHPSSRTGSTLAPSNPRADQSSSILNLFAESIDSKAGDRDEPSVRSALLSRALEPGSLCKSASDGGALSPSSSWSNFFFGGRPTASQILGLPVQEGRITADAIEKSLQQIKEQRRRSTTAEGAAEAGSRPVILVCGPDGMVAALAGSKDQDGRGGQGALGGILKGLNISRSQVFKL